MIIDESPNITPEELLLLDQSFRINSGIYKFTNARGEVIPFKMNEAQQHFDINIHPLSIILKSRRLGFTTYSALRGEDTVLFNPNFKALFISYDEDSATEVFRDIILFAWENLDPELKEMYKVDSSNAKTLRFDFQDKTYSSIQVKTSGRGSGYQYIHISELARIAAKFPYKAQEIFSGTIPALAPQGHAIIESTAEGDSGLFYDTFMQAYNYLQLNPGQKLDPKQWKPFFYNWQWDRQEIEKHTSPLPMDHPDIRLFLDYQKKHNEDQHNKLKKDPLYRPITDQELSFWFYKYIQSGSKWHTLLENYPTTVHEAFNTSKRRYFQDHHIQNAEKTIKTPIDFQFDSPWTLYSLPNPRNRYILGADPSEGVGKDHSAIVILDITNPKPIVVATFISNTDNPYEFAEIIAKQAILYNNAYVVVERNNTGHGTLGTLKDIYPLHLIYHEEKITSDQDITTSRLGWVTNGNSKKMMLGTIKEYLEKDQLLLSSKALVSEIRTYDSDSANQTKVKDPDASNHFDLLMSLSLALVGIPSATSTSDEIITFSPYRKQNTDTTSLGNMNTK